ncbi:MAG: DUF4846 domain-containing protein [Saprospiraceae bacterium]|nr:DUF4846 domain-containing protein [Saprospiraceae bacterium]
MSLLKALVFISPVLFSLCEQPFTESEKSPPEGPSKIYIDQQPDLLPNYAWLEVYDATETIAHRIPAPAGFRRKALNTGSFGEWLRYLPLKPAGSPVLLYDGQKKYNQNAHHAVIQIDVGTRDLQQCADAVMRLKAEYHYSRQEWTSIHFNFSDGTAISFDDWRRGNRPVLNNNSWSIGHGNGTISNSYPNFKKYMNLVFGYAGTASLEKELNRIPAVDLQPGDVFIKGGYPGHAVIVVDIVENEQGEKRFLLAQSYMPAQEIHILKNPANPGNDPWYKIAPSQTLNTPEWTFDWNQLRRFDKE